MKKYSLLSFLCLLSMTAFSQTFNISKTGLIPDNSCVPTTHDFPFATVSGIGVLGDTKIFDQVAINITMSYDSDLDISLIAPNGTLVVLAWGQGGAGDDFTDTVFTADGTQSITEGTAPFNGMYVPEGDLNLLDGVNANGTWILRICDKGPGSVGTLNSASLTFVNKTNNCPKPTQVFSSQITSTSAKLSWNAVAGDKFQYVLNNTPVNSTAGLPEPTDVATFNATNLTPEKNYFFHIRRVCDATLGLYSNWFVGRFTTQPINDKCSDAIGISTLPFMRQQNALGDTNNEGFVKACNSGSPTDLMNDGVWYKFVVTAKGNAQVKVTKDLGWNPRIAVYTGTCENLVCVASSDVGDIGVEETLILNDLLPNTYLVNVADGSGTVDHLEGAFQIDITGDILLLGTDTFDLANFSYYPNPVRNKLNLSYIHNISDVSIYNLLGQQVMEKAINANQSEVDMSGLSSGSYVVKVTADNQMQTFKMVKE